MLTTSNALRLVRPVWENDKNNDNRSMLGGYNWTRSIYMQFWLLYKCFSLTKWVTPTWHHLPSNSLKVKLRSWVFRTKTLNLRWSRIQRYRFVYSRPICVARHGKGWGLYFSRIFSMMRMEMATAEFKIRSADQPNMAHSMLLSHISLNKECFHDSDTLWIFISVSTLC